MRTPWEEGQDKLADLALQVLTEGKLKTKAEFRSQNQTFVAYLAPQVVWWTRLGVSVNMQTSDCNTTGSVAATFEGICSYERACC